MVKCLFRLFYLTMRRLREGCEYGYDTMMNSQIWLNYVIFNFIVEIIFNIDELL